MSEITIALADAQYLIRVGLRHLLNGFDQFKVIGEASNEKGLLELLEKEPVQVIILDHDQPGNFDCTIIKKIKAVSPDSNVLIVSADNEKQNIYSLVEDGVNSFLTKSCDEEEIINAIKATAKGEKFFCHKIINFILEKSFQKEDENCQPTSLTPREIEIVRLVAQGKIAKEIASQLNLSTHTVYTHRKKIMKKMDFKNASELVMYAISKGIVENPVG